MECEWRKALLAARTKLRPKFVWFWHTVDRKYRYQLMHHGAEVLAFGRERDVGELEMKSLRQVNGHRVSSCIILNASRSP